MKTMTRLPWVLPARAALPRHCRGHHQCQDHDPSPECWFVQHDGPANSPTAAASILASACCSPNMLYLGGFNPRRGQRLHGNMGCGGVREPLSATAADAASASPRGAGATAPTGCSTLRRARQCRGTGEPRPRCSGEPAAAQAAPGVTV